MPLDDVDRGLIEMLQADGRASFRRMASRLGVSEATVRARFKRLCAADVLQVVGITNPLGMGFEVMAMVAIKVQGPPRAVADEITGWREASYVVVTTGQFDVLSEFVCRRLEALPRTGRAGPQHSRGGLDGELPVPRSVQAAVRLGDCRGPGWRGEGPRTDDDRGEPMLYGYAGKVLHVDLTSGSLTVEEPPEAFYRTYLGGSAVGVYYLLRNTPPGADPLGPENTLTFAVSGHDRRAHLRAVAAAAPWPAPR